MIKADKISTRVDGSNLEVAIQFLHIMDAMLEHHPEMVAAYISVRNEEIENAIKSANTEEIKFSGTVYNAASIVERMSNDEE